MAPPEFCRQGQHVKTARVTEAVTQGGHSMGSSIGILNFLLGMVIINVLSMVVVPPIAQRWANRSANKRIVSSPGVSPKPFIFKPLLRNAIFVDKATADKKAQGIADTRYYLTAILVLGLGGFISGCFGIFFIGFPFTVKGLPGLAAFLGASFLGMALAGCLT